MIVDTKLTYAKISKGGVAESYLFAKTKEPPRKGELTSDFLAFFGFGSGNFNGHIVTKEIENNNVILFPVEEDNYIRNSSLVQHLLDTLGREFYIEPVDIKRAFNYLATIHSKDYTKVLSDIESIGINTKPHLHPLILYGVNQDGTRFYGIGMTKTIEKSPAILNFIDKFNMDVYPVTEFPYFVWGYWTGLSSVQHTRGIFGAMRNLHFMSSTHEEQNSIIARIEAEILRIIDVG